MLEIAYQILISASQTIKQEAKRVNAPLNEGLVDKVINIYAGVIDKGVAAGDRCNYAFATMDANIYMAKVKAKMENMGIPNEDEFREYLEGVYGVISEICNNCRRELGDKFIRGAFVQW